MAKDKEEKPREEDSDDLDNKFEDSSESDRGIEESSQIELSQENLEEALREKEQFRTMAQRAQADLVNYRNRATQELEEARRTARFAVLTRFLNVIDGLSRAVQSLPDGADDSWTEGISLVLRNLEKTFESEGISKIDSFGAEFDPYQHEALMYEQTEDAEEGTVVNVIQEGYKIGDRILRPARVVVAQKPEVLGEESEEIVNDDTCSSEGSSEKPLEQTQHSTKEEEN